MDDQESNVTAVPASSPLATLRDKVAAARRLQVTDCEIAGLDGVVVRYSQAKFDVLEQFSRRNRRDGAAEVNAALLVEACVGVFVRDDDGRLVSIDPDDPDSYIDHDGKTIGEPLTFRSERLGELLGIDDPSGPAVVKAMFPRELQIASHADHVLEFSRGEAAGVVRASLGN